MVRKIAGLLVLLFAFSLSTAAQDKKEAKKEDDSPVIGTFESYKNEILKLKVEDKKKEFTVPKEFKVPGNTDVGYASSKDEPKVEKAKEHLKDVKKGWLVSVTLDRDKKTVLAVGVFVPDSPKDKPKDNEKEEKEKQARE